MKQHSGKAMFAVLAVLIVLGGIGALGAWNYFRNVEAEGQVFRPYRGVSDAELDQLASAYRAESERAESRYGAARAGAGRVRDRADLSDRLDEFERVRRRSERTRELGAQASELQSTLRAIEEELAHREGERDRTALFLRRLLSF